MSTNFNSLIESLKMFYMMNFKEYNIYQNIGIIIIILGTSLILNNDNYYENLYNYLSNFFQKFSIFFPRCNSVILEGKRCLKVTAYLTKTDNLFSNRFEAFWYYISKNNLNNESIYRLQEYANSSNIYDDYGDPIKYCSKKWNNDNNNTNNDSDNDINIINKDIFIVDQITSFKLSDKLYCKVYKNVERSDEKKQYEMENISIEIYMYILSLEKRVEFIDKLEENYRNLIENHRKNKKYIYTLVGNNDNDSRQYENGGNKWEECEFISTRNFNNLFFEQKKLLINKLNFFINNKKFYEYEGLPYTFGIGLHGPPGTGKTSIIKCIANKLNRHIIVIPLNKVKTQKEFSEYFFENYYTRDNNKKINFEDKIIVFEDIDCMSNIVKKRENEIKKIKSNDELDFSINNNDDNNIEKSMHIQNRLLNKIAKKVDDEHEETMLVDFNKNKDDKITLSFILNIIDGIRETPGRILIITSNDYDSLDPALIRPGRIDLTLEMKNANIDVIKEMYNHYYKSMIPEEIETSLIDNVVSPAKLINIRLQNDNKEDFLNALLKEFNKY